jgi:hypothetical protein
VFRFSSSYSQKDLHQTESLYGIQEGCFIANKSPVKLKVKVMLRPTVNPKVVPGTYFGLMTRFYYCQKVAGLLM